MNDQSKADNEPKPSRRDRVDEITEEIADLARELEKTAGRRLKEVWCVEQPVDYAIVRALASAAFAIASSQVAAALIQQTDQLKIYGDDGGAGDDRDHTVVTTED